MTIQIVANPNANAIELRGMNRGVFYNACLSGSVNLTDSDRVDIINDVRTGAEGEAAYEAYAIHYTEILDADGAAFSSAIEAAAYITAECNQIVGSGAKVVGPTTEIRFTLDATNTTVLLSDGASFPVNAIKAVAGADGHIEIWEHGENGVQLYDDAHLAFTYAAGSLVPQNLAGAVNTLNALFTVSPVGGGGGWTPVYPTLDGVAITPVAAGGQDPIGDNIYGSTSTSQHGARYRSTEYIDAPGEYFTFRMANQGQFIFGLGSVGNGDVAEFDASSGNGHSGLFYSQAMYDYGSYMAPWTTYGSNSGLSYGPGWSFYGNDPMFRYSVAQQNMSDGNDALFKVEIMAEGFVGCYYYDIDETNDWILLSRSTTPLPEGDYFLGIKLASTSGQLVEIPLRWATDDAAPVMGYRFIESPDGAFDYPLFATAEEAEWYDLNVASPAGSGQSQQVTYVDDSVAGTIWRRPVSGFTNDAASAPTSSASQAYTRIATQSDSLFAPAVPAFSDQLVNEGDPVNIQVAPAGAVSYTTTLSGLPPGLAFDGASTIQGTAPEVAGDNVSNPSDVFTVTVTRTNAYGAGSGTFDLTVANLTQPVTPATGTTHVSGTAALVDSDTLDDGSAVTIDDTVATGQRFVMSKEYVEANILPALTASGDVAYAGVQASGATMSSISDADFDIAIKFEWTSSSSHTVTLLGAGLSSNALTISSLTDAVYDYAFELDSASNLVAIGCNLGAINSEPAVSDGGSFTRTLTKASHAGPAVITFAVLSAQMDLVVGDLSEISIPAASVNSTSWGKALHFSGSNEFAVHVNGSTAHAPIRMDGLAALAAAPAASGNTSSSSNARPWAAAIVFKSDGNNSSQHIWNQGEGGSNGDDNIYLRLSSTGQLYFGWKREGTGSNEKQIASVTTGQWYGVYVGHNGARLSGSDATSANLDAAFDIKVADQNFIYQDEDPTQFLVAPSSAWTSTGLRMDRAVDGSFTVGGRGNSRSFHGLVASMVTTTLKRAASMPTGAEAKKMMLDPMGWLNDYKVGQTYRITDQSYSGSGFSIGNSASSKATQIWLMGDGTLDSFGNGMRNQVYPADQNNTKLNLNSMVTNDIETVSITGLT